MLPEETLLVSRSIKQFLVGAAVDLFPLHPQRFCGIDVSDLLLRSVKPCDNDRICGAYTK
jgi:hypothetical protein